MDTSSPLIRLRNVSRHYFIGGGEVNALDGVTLDIHAGEFVAIMGPSGSGKTTLMNIIGCLDRPSGGEYYYDGWPAHTAGPDQRARLRREVFGFIFQNYNLLGMATARENVEIPAIYAGTRKNKRLKRATELLSRLGLGLRLGHQPTELSGGEQQRVAIARALMNGGRVILADEPTGSLDSRTGKEILAQLESLADQGHTVIVVTHDAAVAAHARRRIELLDGRVTADTRTGPESRAGARAGPGHSPPQRTAGVRAPALSLQESARTALRTLRGNKFRTALTLLGIIIGVLSVTAMLAVAEGVRRAVLDNFSALGGASLTVTASNNQDQQASPLTLEDADAIREQVPNLLSVAPQMTGSGTLVAGGEETWTFLIATTSHAMEDGNRTLAQGAFFTESQNRDYAPVMVLGGSLASELFGEEANPVGEYVLVNGAPIQVIGVLERPTGTFAAFDFRARAAYLPLMTGAVRLFNRDNLNSIDVLVTDTELVESAQEEISTLLTRRHGSRDFDIQNQAELIEAENAAAAIMQLLFGSIGGISLIVAGIGVMNIMLASVAERTREIGVRMATGARQRDILMQFVCEAIVVSGLGGLVGLLLAMGLGGLLSALTPVQIFFTPQIVLIGLSCATLTGLLFGFAPARRAARLDPVVALAAQ